MPCTRQVCLSPTRIPVGFATCKSRGKRRGLFVGGADTMCAMTVGCTMTLEATAQTRRSR
eukprot:CAMPEP_0177409286 /NCGR_PEP_ID=MMETSP0368-20130122/64161_1 /TAXON_ID=447022 ORGANISM="Scrippsiella hangoei-like, Strain SHHI-4" /NCGR_SAMPLE_ID=MMETSP0368 /ASSEMBLY_ACC=CAM_ASM_000363 /LENGTH=59 /DNA_ID=CAMNT_0018878041 /DNA_START=9 /DNA_END=184 /DNA_ORIENTATION=+